MIAQQRCDSPPFPLSVGAATTAELVVRVRGGDGRSIVMSTQSAGFSESFFFGD